MKTRFDPEVSYLTLRQFRPIQELGVKLSPETEYRWQVYCSCRKNIWNHFRIILVSYAWVFYTPSVNSHGLAVGGGGGEELAPPGARGEGGGKKKIFKKKKNIFAKKILNY